MRKPAHRWYCDCRRFRSVQLLRLNAGAKKSMALSERKIHWLARVPPNYCECSFQERSKIIVPQNPRRPTFLRTMLLDMQTYCKECDHAPKCCDLGDNASHRLSTRNSNCGLHCNR